MLLECREFVGVRFAAEDGDGAVGKFRQEAVQQREPARGRPVLFFAAAAWVDGDATGKVGDVGEGRELAGGR